MVAGGHVDMEEWELISHEVILQLLFSGWLTHLTLVTQTLSWLLFLRLLDVRHFAPLHPAPPPPPPPHPPSQKNMESPRCDWAVRAELMCRLMCVKMRDDRTRGRWDYLGKNHLNKVGHSFLLLCPLLLGVGGLRGGERSSGGVAATQG